MPSVGEYRIVPTSTVMRIDPPAFKSKLTLRQLYPHLSDSQVSEADEMLSQYVSFALRVFQRIEQDPDAWARFQALTVGRRDLRMKHKGSQTTPPKGP